MVSWQAMHAERVEALRLLRKGVGFMVNRRLSGGLRRWRSNLLGGRDSAATSKALRHMRNRGLSKGWRAWDAMASERREALRLMRKGLGFMVNRELARGLSQLRARLETGNIMAKGMGHMMNRELSRGWRAWIAMLDERAEAMRLLRKGLAYMMSREVARGLSKWRHANETDDVLWRPRRTATTSSQSSSAGAAGCASADWRSARCATHSREHVPCVAHVERARAHLPLVLAQRAADFFMARGTVGAFHQWLERKKEADAVLERTFANAASILPIAGGRKLGVARGSRADGPRGGERSPQSPVPATPPPKKATPARPPARPRMVFH